MMGQRGQVFCTESHNCQEAELGYKSRPAGFSDPSLKTSFYYLLNHSRRELEFNMSIWSILVFLIQKKIMQFLEFQLCSMGSRIFSMFFLFREKNVIHERCCLER